MSEISEAQLNANRANAHLSHGPVTPEGKARSSTNAYRHGLTGRKMVIPDEEIELYTKHVQSFLDCYQPQTAEERAHVQLIADYHWRLDRAMSIEDNLKMYLDTGMLERGSLTNIALYLTRIKNMLDRSVKQLKELQATRKAEEQCRLEEAILLAKYHKMLEEPFDPQENGFVFSASEIVREIGRRDALEQAALAAKTGFDRVRYRFRLEQEAKDKAA
ncbi:MAG TPA: hypothetical protein VH640_31420 [Bryobacteraceae bacterium]|jgi:hypothetical protein